MAIPHQLRLPRALNAALLPLLFWACSNGGASGDDPPRGGEGSKAGSAAMNTVEGGAPGAGGATDDPGDVGTGNTGSVGMDDDPPDDMPNGGKGGDGKPDPNPAAGAAGEGGGEGPDPDPDPDPRPSEAYLRGEALAELNQCVTCHQANYAGFTVFPNITPDVETGIGSWTDEQIVAALRDGKDADGASLCSTMQRYSFTDAQAADVVAFLRGLPAVSNAITLDCP